MSKLRLLITSLVVVLLLSSCTTFTYNRLDWLIPWYVHGYVDLTREQRKILRKKLTTPLEWHREEELANYIKIIDRIEDDFKGEVDAAIIRSWADEMMAAAARVQRSLLVVALEFGDEISNKQVEEFIAKLWERQDELEEEYSARDDEEYADDDFESLVDILERFMGRLTREQKAILRDTSTQLVRFDKAWLEEGRAWLKTIEKLLERNPGWQDAILEAYDARTRLRSPEYRAAFEHNMNLSTQAYAEAIAIMTDKQRSKLAEEFDDLRRLLTKLMGNEN